MTQHIARNDIGCLVRG